MKKIVNLLLILLFNLTIGITSCKKNEAELPVIITGIVADIKCTSATITAEVTYEGDSPVISKGICWGLIDSPTILNNKTDEIGGSGAFSSSINQLRPNTEYHARAYATNSSGTAYGTQVSFYTKSITLPSVITTDITSVTQTSAISGGIILDNGGNITSSGVCWSTLENPTINDNRTSDGSSTGTFSSNLSRLAGNTKYYVRAYASNSAGTSYGNQVSFTTFPVAPILSTKPISSLSATSATTGGNITGDGGSEITEYGIVWGNSVNPVTTDNKIALQGPISGIYQCNITGLEVNTLYHVRAYAVNSIGISYGADISFTTDPLNVSDADGNIYNVIRIGSQLWMKENLRTTKYQNGDAIPTTATPLTDVTIEEYPKYQWAYAGNEANVPVNGRLYTWDAATDVRNVCPVGWHLPTDNQWTELTDFLTKNGYGFEGSGNDIAKSMASTNGWQLIGSAGDIGNNLATNNSSGFSAFPSGARVHYYVYGDIVVYFSMLGVSCTWWSSTELNAILAYQRILVASDAVVSRSYYGSKKTAASVRCLRNN